MAAFETSLPTACRQRWYLRPTDGGGGEAKQGVKYRMERMGVRVELTKNKEPGGSLELSLPMLPMKLLMAGMSTSGPEASQLPAS